MGPEPKTLVQNPKPYIIPSSSPCPSPKLCREEWVVLGYPTGGDPVGLPPTLNSPGVAQGSFRRPRVGVPETLVPCPGRLDTPGRTSSKRWWEGIYRPGKGREGRGSEAPSPRPSFRDLGTFGVSSDLWSFLLPRPATERSGPSPSPYKGRNYSFSEFMVKERVVVGGVVSYPRVKRGLDSSTPPSSIVWDPTLRSPSRPPLRPPTLSLHHQPHHLHPEAPVRPQLVSPRPRSSTSNLLPQSSSFSTSNLPPQPHSVRPHHPGPTP